MNNDESIGVIIDELINSLNDVINDKDIDIFERDSLEFGIKLLKYLVYLCDEEGIDLKVEHDYKGILD